jgi:hypothetical protein
MVAIKLALFTQQIATGGCFMPDDTKRSDAAKEKADISREKLRVLESPMSVIKMDVSELRNFTNRINDFLKGPEVASIRICECCINIE